MTTFRPTLPAAILGLCVALGPALAGYFIYKGILEAKQSDRYVTAKGLVERIEKADRGVWEINFKASGNNPAELYQKVSHDSTIISNALKKEGVEEKEMSISPPRVLDLHAREWGNGTHLSPERYIIESTLHVNSRNVDNLNKLSELTGQFINKGITITNTSTSFYLDKFNSLRPQLIEEAIKNAQEVAVSFARTTDSQLGGIRKGHQGSFTITDPNASPNAEYDQGVNSLMKKIRVVSTIEFYLK